VTAPAAPGAARATGTTKKPTKKPTLASLRDMALLTHTFFRERIRQKKALAVMLTTPLLITLVFFAIFHSLTTLHVSVAVVDMDRTPTSRFIADALASVGGAEVEKVDTVDEAFSLLERGKVEVVLVIPNGTEQKWLNISSSPETNETMVFTVYYRGGDRTPEKIVEAVLAGAEAEINSRITGEKTSGPVEIKKIPVTEGWGYRDALLPMSIAIAVSQIGIYGGATAMSSYRERGLLRMLQLHYRKKHPDSAAPLHLTTAVTLPEMVLAIAGVAITAFAGLYLFQARPPSLNYAFFALATAMGAFSMAALGTAAGGLADSRTTAIFFSTLIYLPLLFLTMASTFPLLFPPWLKKIAYVSPLTMFTETARILLLHRPVAADYLPYLGGMFVWGVIFIAIQAAFRKTRRL